MNVKEMFLPAVLLVFVSVVTQVSNAEEEFLSNVDVNNCLKCLCMAASGCHGDIGCSGLYCGPFQMSLAYYLDATENTTMARTQEAFVQCSQDYNCAQRVVRYYLAKYAKDCNEDGVTDCTDFAMINYYGGYNCTQNLFRFSEGASYAGRFLNCTVYDV